MTGVTTVPGRREPDQASAWLRGREASPTLPVPGLLEMTRYLRQRCAELFGKAEADIPTDVAFTALGLDSLDALRLSNQVLTDFGCSVSLREILTCAGIESLAAVIHDDQSLKPDGDDAGYRPIRPAREPGGH
jgi:acyl carrier protein